MRHISCCAIVFQKAAPNLLWWPGSWPPFHFVIQTSLSLFWCDESHNLKDIKKWNKCYFWNVKKIVVSCKKKKKMYYHFVRRLKLYLIYMFWYPNSKLKLCSNYIGCICSLHFPMPHETLWAIINTPKGMSAISHVLRHSFTASHL